MIRVDGLPCELTDYTQPPYFPKASAGISDAISATSTLGSTINNPYQFTRSRYDEIADIQRELQYRRERDASLLPPKAV